MPGSNEMFYLDADGRKQDAELHNAILAEGDELSVVAATRRRLIAEGYDPETIAYLYPDPPKADMYGKTAVL